jgi:hypothetical protein
MHRDISFFLIRYDLKILQEIHLQKGPYVGLKLPIYIQYENKIYIPLIFCFTDTHSF